MPDNVKRRLLSKPALVALVIVIICLCIAVFAIGLQPEENADKIYTKIYIHSVPVGGLTATEAEAVLMERFQLGLESQTIKFLLNNETVAEFSFTQFGAEYDFTNLVQEALDYSQLRNLPRRIGRMFGFSYKIDAPIGLKIEPQRVEGIFNGLLRKVGVAAQNASFAMEDGNIVVSAESTGRGIEVQALALATEEVLRSFQSGVVELVLHEVLPEYTVADFNFPVSVLGSFRTKYTGGETDPRVYNVRLASDRINNQVLHPGQTFSAGTLIAAHKPNSGYKSAIVLVRGEPVEDIGGGVCQVVSTLYNAVLAAELPVIQRHNHSAPVSYVESGFDATVAGDYFDLKFQNNSGRPILVVSQMKNGELIITIHGYETRPPGRSIRFSANRVKVTQPEPYREVVDRDVPLGERYIVLESQLGYHIELLKHVYIDGSEVEVVKINTSIYKPLQGVIAIGAGQ